MPNPQHELTTQESNSLPEEGQMPGLEAPLSEHHNISASKIFDHPVRTDMHEESHVHPRPAAIPHSSIMSELKAPRQHVLRRRAVNESSPARVYKHPHRQRGCRNADTPWRGRVIFAVNPFFWSLSVNFH